METDLHLLSRYHRHGDAEAFQSLVEAHAGMVHATARRVTRDAELAQDVAQETFLALARSSGAAIQSVGAWLHHVAWQKAQNIVRGESRRQSYEAAAAVQMNEPADEATWADLEPLLDAALAELPEKTRTVVIERYLEGRSQQELAARMGVSQSTVSRQLDAAIRELRICLRSKGAFCGAGLALLLSTHTVEAAPASLTASLGKLAISGVGTSTAIPPGAAITATLIAMTTTTKVLLAIATVAAISVPIVLHRPAAVPSKPQAAQAKAQPVAKGTSVAKTESASETRHYRPAPVTGKAMQTVEDIIRRHKGMTKPELQKSAELNKLMDRFLAVMGTPEMQVKMEQRIAALPRAPGAENGMVKMDFDMLDDAHGRAWLEAAVSDDTQLMEDWLLNTLDGAIFEFAFDPALERTSNGVSVQPGTAAKPDAPADDKAKD